MVFNSYIFFLIFLPVFLLGFFFLRKRTVGGTKCWIILASVLFYVPFGVRNCAVLAFSLLLNSLIARRLDLSLGKHRQGKATEDGVELEHKRKAADKVLFAVAVIADLVTLLAFKFLGIFFPIAISFYTFNQISYLVDLYRGEVEEFELQDYLCYILFFPKILQGPLMGYGDFKEQLDAAIEGRNAEAGISREVDYELILRGLYLFSMGLFKKVILADSFGKAVDYGFENIAGLGSLEAILVSVFYSFQLYFDFSGYCDMASAICMMMGFELPVNFNSPYKAVSIVDFWKRWHITLTRFFTKYVYIPLGGNRKGLGRMYLNFMIVFLLSGLWHGNGWNFIVWGAMHGVLYVVTRAFNRVGKSGIKAADDKTPVRDENMSEKIFRAAKVLLTFIYVNFAWVFFRASNVNEAVQLIVRMLTGGNKKIATQLSSCFQLDELWYVIKVTPVMKLSFAWDTCLWLFLIVAAVMIFFLPNALEVSKKSRIGIKTTLVTVVLLFWCIISFAGVSTFLYMNF